jgi:glucuronoarabinoxylan endo-1,4-beta-xylanase
MGQFSKFIRPGSHRVSAPYQPQGNLKVQAFAGERNVIVALNRSSSPLTQTFTVVRGGFTAFHQCTTSESKKLGDDGTVTATDHSFTATLDSRSVTTFVAE